MKKNILPLIMGDIIGFILAFILSYLVFISYNLGIHSQMISSNLLAFYIIEALIGIMFFMQKGHYKLSTPWWQQVKHISLFSIYSLLLLCFLFFTVKADPSRLFITLSWVSLIPILMITRQVTRRILIKMNKWNIPTIIVGGFENATETLYALKSESYINYDVKEVILPNATPKQIQKFKNIHEGYEVKKDIPEFKKNYMVVICPDTRRELKLANLTKQITDTDADFVMVPPIEGFSYYGLRPSYFFGYNIILFRQTNKLSLINKLMKNSMDRIGAAIGILVLSPIFLYVAYKIKQDGGPVFYGDDRVGKGGKIFKCWKFRSMIVDAKYALDELLENDPAAREEWSKSFKLKNDPRVTKIGKLIRKTSIDELPQLFNVLIGEMSLVGPRPLLENEIEYYGDKIEAYNSVNPGITGLWQVSGRSDLAFEQRVYLDRWYVRHWSIWTDMVIIIKTIFVVSNRTGAY